MCARKKIGIVTYWESLDNYGQQLQCWALQQYLRSIGHVPYLIRARMFTCISKKSIIKSVIKRTIKVIEEEIANTIIACYGLHSKYISKYILALFGKDWAYRRFNIFRRKYIKHSRVYNSYVELANNPPKADVYIAGSDQIWNADLTREIWNITFLQFGDRKVKRVAYAPSMSICNLDSEQKLLFNDYLQSFSALSAREENTVKRCKELGYQCELVIDPTLLLSADDYMTITQSKHKTPYIFLYSINYETANEIPPIDELKKIAQVPSCRVIVTTGGGYIKNEELLKDEVIYDYATIPEWIGNIKNSELVVTPSFHGIVYAIIFHRNFVFTPLQGRFAKGNERVFDLLRNLNIQGHIFGQDGMNSNINWNDVEKRLHQLKDKSMLYLNNAIDQ